MISDVFKVSSLSNIFTCLKKIIIFFAFCLYVVQYIVIFKNVGKSIDIPVKFLHTNNFKIVFNIWLL